MSPRIFVTTSDRYLPALRPFAYLLNKYWLPEASVVVAGFDKPHFSLPANFTFVSLGKQADYPFERWSDALIDTLSAVDDPTLVLMLEDYWIIRPVDTTAVDMLNEYLLQEPDVLKIDLTGDRLYAHGVDLYYGYLGYLDLIKSMPGSPYHMSLMAGLWRRDNLLSALITHESPHEVELTGTTRVSHMQNLVVLGTRQWPLKHTLALRGGDSSKLLLDEINPTDVEELRSLGFLAPWEDQHE